MTESAELRLAIECCRRSFSGPAGQDLTCAAAVNWDRFLRIARFHRIEGLAWKALSEKAFDAPEAVEIQLSKAASEIAASNLQASADCRTLLERFDAADTPLLFLKGLTLGALAYGNSALKAAIDIDLLVDPADLAKAAGLLRDCEYRLVAPRDSAGDIVLDAWHRGWKESVWAKDRPPLQIDLHTRTADNPRLITGIGAHSPRQVVEISRGIRLPTLAPEELFAYLAVHGASSAWFRLKWISDFAALVQRAGAEEIDRLYRRSQALGAGRAAGQALLLADEIFETLGVAPSLRDELNRDRATRRLYRAALRQLTGEPIEPTEQRLGTMAIHWTQFLLLPGPGYKASELWRQTSRLFDRP